MGQKASQLEEKLKAAYYRYGEEGALLNNEQKLLEMARTKLGEPRATLRQIREFLSKQPSYTVHHRVRSLSFPHRKILVSAPKLRIDADLIELRDLSDWNSGYKYILTLIDAFTRYVWCEPLKSKHAESTATALRKLRLEDPLHLHALFLYTDAGREFIGAPFQAVLADAGMQHRICSSEDFHCPFVERVQRTLQEKLFQAMTAEHTRRWLDLLPAVVRAYNRTDHSSIAMTPTEARDPRNYIKALRKSYPTEEIMGLKQPDVTYKFRAGDLVRILKKRENRGMEKGYLPNFSWEIFRIKQLANQRPQDRHRRTSAYILEDLHGEEIKNAVFYEPELVRVHPDQLYSPMPVREILSEEKDRVLVWFQGHPRSSAVWVSRKNLV